MSLALRAWGGQLLQAQRARGPLFYLSPQQPVAGAAVRGGVPVLFPQFALAGPLNKHGFARNRDWQTLHETSDEVLTELAIAADSEPAWPHAALLRMRARWLPDGCFEQTLTVINQGLDAFAFTGGLHPYWACDDLAAVRVTGVPTPGLGSDEIDAWHPGGGEVIIRESSRVLRLTQQGFEGWQMWSPGPAHVLRDLPHDDWRRFLCIEPVIMTPLQLRPGETWSGVLRASAGQAHEQELQ